jgi:16S rRNA processing protein RimM
MSRDILLGVVIGASGLKGEVKVKTFTENPERLGAYGTLTSRDGRSLRVRSVRTVKPDQAVVRFDGVDGREGAEGLKGFELFVARDALPEPDADEFYHADLIGLAAVDAAGHAMGRVTGISNFGAGDVIAIARAEANDEILLPFTRAIVPVIDIAAGHIVIAPPDETPDDAGRAT